MEIEFQGQYDKELLLRAVSLVYRPARLSTILRWAAVLIFAGLYIALVVSTLQEEDAGAFDAARMLRHLTTFGVLIYFALYPILVARRTAGKLWADPAIRLPLRGKVTSLGVTYLFSTSQRDLPWEKFAKIRRTDDLVVLQTSDGLLSIFSRSFFASDDDWNRLQQMVDYRVKEAK